MQREVDARSAGERVPCLIIGPRIPTLSPQAAEERTAACNASIICN